MIKKLNNKQLLLILVVLVGIYGIARFINYKRGENTFRTHIIPKIDTNKINSMYVYPKIRNVKPIQFDLKGNTWMVSQGGVTSRAEPTSKHYLVQVIEAITPDHLATNDPAQWKDYDVTDSTGTRVVLLNGKDTLIDLLVGKFSYNNQLRRAMSCVRLHGQNEVYGVDGFLTMNVANEFAAWRDRQLINGEPATWNKLTFTYPGNNIFVLYKDIESGEWKFKTEGNASPTTDVVDSIGVREVLSKLSQQNYGKFVDRFDTNATQPVCMLRIENNKQGVIVLKAYPADSINQYVVTSSINPGAYMSGKNEALFHNVFPSPTSFFQHSEAPKAPPQGNRPMVKKVN